MYALKERFHMRTSQELILSRVVASFGLAIGVSGFYIKLSEIGYSDAQIGLLSGLATAISLLAAATIPPVLEKFNIVHTYFWGSFGFTVTYLLFGLNTTLIFAVLLMASERLLYALTNDARGIIFRDAHPKKFEYTNMLGIASALGNLGWFVGPLLAGFVMAQFGVSAALYLGAIFLLLDALMYVISPVRATVKHRKRIDVNAIKNTKYFLSKKSLRHAYTMKLGHSIWWGFVWVFVPLAMYNNGYSLAQVGIFFSATQLPLFLLESYTVRYFKRIGWRRLFFWCYTLMGASALAAFAFNNIEATIILFLLGSLPMTCIEPAGELFYFDKVSSIDEEKTYPIFLTALDVGSFISRVGAGVVIGVFGVQYSSLFIGIVLLYLARYAHTQLQ